MAKNIIVKDERVKGSEITRISDQKIIHGEFNVKLQRNRNGIFFFMITIGTSGHSVRFYLNPGSMFMQS
jgi:hypothetical protein